MAAWSFEHSVETKTGREVAWRFWSNVANWAKVDPAVEWVRLDGPFAPDTTGVTKPVGQEEIHWRLAEVESGERAVVEILTTGAVLRFTMRFEDKPDGGTRMTQTVTLDGERAAEYIAAVEELKRGMPVGMARLAAAIDRSVTARSN
jgi:hypothetical protein